MNITGIIAEFNPLHNGHLHLLRQARETVKADRIIVAMSGDFTQRGEPAICDKYTRTRMALSNGADLVLELPVRYATGSAEFFAGGAVGLLSSLGVADTLVFGSESGDIALLKKAADVLSQESPDFREKLGTALRQGFTFPQARLLALRHQSELPSLLSSPNNILGVEYIKAILRQHSSLEPITIPRSGSDYHDGRLAMDRAENGDFYSSASAVRSVLESGENLACLGSHVPPDVLSLLSETAGRSLPILADDFSSLLRYQLLTSTCSRLSEYQDVGEELAARILSNLPDFSSFRQFCLLLKTRNLTYTRISRALLHILLQLPSPPGDETWLLPPYARILGFRKNSADVLTAIKKNASIPLISKLADARALLSDEAMAVLNEDILSAHIYDSVAADKFSSPFPTEYRRSLVICP